MSKVVSIVIASSNSGRGALEGLLGDLDSHQAVVRAVFRSEEKAQSVQTKYASAITANRLQVVTGVDATIPETLSKAFEGAYAALIVTPEDHSRGFGQDHLLAIQMIDSAVAHGCRHIIFVGSFTAAEPAVGVIAARFIPVEKHLEQLAAEGKVQYVSLRSGFFHQNFCNFVGKGIREENTIYWPDELNPPSVDPADMGRIGAALLGRHLFPASGEGENSSFWPSPLDKKGKIYDISGPERIGRIELARHFNEALNRTDITSVAVPFDKFVSALPSFLGDLLVQAKKNPNLIPLSPDVEKVTGIPPRSFRQYLQENPFA